MASDNKMIFESLKRIEKKQTSLQETLNNSILDQGKANVHYQLGIKELKEKQEKTDKSAIKNAPVIAWAAKLQSNMSKIVTGLIIAITGSWVVGSASNKADTPVKPEVIIKSGAKND
jgi:hypothetical protein